MSKLKKIINSLLLGVCAMCISGGALLFSNTQSAEPKSIAGAATVHEQVENNLQEFFKIETEDGEKTDDNVVFLINSDHRLKLSVANDDIITSEVDTNKHNYAYIPSSPLNSTTTSGELQINEYYYFNFSSALSLYYNTTNLDIDDQTTGLVNLLSTEDISLFASYHDNAFPIPTYDLTPQKLNINFRLDPSQTNNCEILTDESGNKTNTVSVKQEGCYTLAIPISYYHTIDGGATFSTTTTVTYYTFMLFNYTSYFDSASGLPLVSAANIHEAVLSNSASHSRYYYYNYSTSALPSFSYNPSKYQITIQYTDTDSNVITGIVDCNTLDASPTPVLVDNNGNEIANPFAFARYSNQNGQEVVTLTFAELGQYDISFTFLYKTNTRIFEIPLTALRQRFYNFGYQTYYTDYAVRDDNTNIAESRPFKGISEDKTEFINAADITPLLTNETVRAGTAQAYNADDTENALLEAINKDSINPVSTNQTPIRFVTNSTLIPRVEYDASVLYTLTKDEFGNWAVSTQKTFDGLNINQAGTYLAVIDYTYNSYLSISGTAQSTFHHQQAFFFTIENTAPTVTTVDNDGKEIRTRGFTNQDVYVVDNSASSLYDAQVTIKISARNYITGVEFLPETDIKNFATPAFGIEYFEKAAVPGFRDEEENYILQTGIHIDASARNIYRNATYTISLYFANSNVPSVSSFTIDTIGITNLVAKNVSYSTSSSYTVGNTVENGKTNGPVVFSWENKQSGAQTYGYYRYYRLNDIDFYNTNNNLLLYNLIGSNDPYNMIPVEAMLNLTSGSNWTEYFNAKDYAQVVPSTYVRDQAGLYVLEVYDEAGNADFATFLIDNTSPLFVKTIITNSGTTRNILGTSDTIMISDTITRAMIEWSKYKGIRINLPSSLDSLKSTYSYDELVDSEKAKLGQVIDTFLSEENTIELRNISGSIPPSGSAITSYNGTYLKIDVNDYYYFKHALDSRYRQQEGTRYEFTLIDENDEPVEGTYKFLLCDYSNAHFTHNELTAEYEFTNFPSNFLTINVSSDMSEMEVKLNGQPLEKNGYSLTGALYRHTNKDSGEATLEKTNTTADEKITVTNTDFTYKYQYYVPVKTEQPLTLSFIPLSQTDTQSSQVAKVTLSYYPYVVTTKEVPMENGTGKFTATAYYYTLSETPTKEIDIFNYSSSAVYIPGREQTFDLSFSGTGIASPGKYVITRSYLEDEDNVDKYDYYQRISTLIVDRFNVLSSKESINSTTIDEITGETISHTSLESIVGGDMLVTMYSGQDQASLQVAFPTYNPSTGLNEGSLYTSASFDSETSLISEVLITNKLPLEVKIPEYKYTINYTYDKNTNSYSVINNNILSRLGNAEMRYLYDFETAEVRYDASSGVWRVYIDGTAISGLYNSEQNAENALELYKLQHIAKYQVYVEGILAAQFDFLSDAEAYLASTEIEEYKLQATIIQTNSDGTKYYKTNGKTTNGYLNFYQVDSVANTVPDNATPVVFKEAGTYNVIIYQAANSESSATSFKNFYRFSFVVNEPQPNFEVYSDGRLVNSKTDASGIENYYTNSQKVTVSWTDDTSKYSKYIANLDPKSVVITYSDNHTKNINFDDPNSTYKLTTEGATHSFVLDLQAEGIWQTASYLTITMKLEGDDGSTDIYKPISKRINIDYTAPTENLASLMNNISTSVSWFDRHYQETNTRTLVDYNGNEIDSSLWGTQSINDLMRSVSYSYTTTSPTFNKYSYNVTKNFFATLESSISNDYRGVQNIYFKEIYDDEFNSYTQVTASSFSETSYRLIDEWSDVEVNTYYEIVEMDTAGNMVVYLVYVYEPDNYKTMFDFESNEYITKAIEFKNGSIGDVKITDSDIVDDFNLYSRSGFEITGLNFLSDNWGFYRFTQNNVSSLYMKSPWLEQNQIYRVGLANGGLSFTIVNLAELYANVASSSYKYDGVLVDRFNGSAKNIHIAIMDADLSTSKTSDLTTGTLNITVPTAEQANSTTRAFVYPVQITIYSSLNGEWQQIPVYDQRNTSGNPANWLSERSDIQISYLGNILSYRVSIGVMNSQKLKYVIVDNFGYTTTIIQLVNEETCTEVLSINGGQIYESNETDGSTTYLSADSLSYQYNQEIYAVEVYSYDVVTNQFVRMTANQLSWGRYPNTQTIYSYRFYRGSTNYDYVYQIRIFDKENYDERDENRKADRVINLRLYNRLPIYQTTTDVSDSISLISLKDKNNEFITDYGTQRNITVTINGRTYVTNALSINTYSSNVTAAFTNGQFNSENRFAYTYHYQYNYSVYFSSDDGNTWTNINDYSSAYRISGTGNYKLLVVYDDDEIFNDQCLLLDINILDSSRVLYYVTVDENLVSRSDIIYTGPDNKQYYENYLVSVNYSDKNDRVRVVENNELGIILSYPTTVTTGTNVYVDIYQYISTSATGYFTIIYIGETHSILTTLYYEDDLGSPTPMLETSSVNIVASETQTDFSRLKIAWTPFYGIRENEIKIEVQKLFNNQYVQVEIDTYSDGINRYAYLTRSGTYRIRFTDSCIPANAQYFNGGEYISLVFLKDVPFTVTYTTPDGEEVVTEPITRAVYNSEVKLSLVNLSSYFQTSGYPTISVTKDGQEYHIAASNYVYSFTETGYYVVKFSAVSSSGVAVREEEFIFSIINPNESRFAYEFPTYSTYYIAKVVKDGVDITDNLVRLAGNNIVIKNGKSYLSNLLTSFFDERTGSGRYVVTINTGEQSYKTITANEFTFSFWINLANPPVKVSIEEGSSTTDDIVMTFNAYNLHEAVGDCYIQIASDRYAINADTLASIGGDNANISITRSGTYYIQIYTTSNNLLYSYKVTKTDPMNAWTIIAIVLAVVAVIAVTVITILLRKRLKVK